MTTTTDYDAAGRPQLITRAGTATQIDYSDANRTVTRRADVATSGGRELVQKETYDTLGRIQLGQQLSAGVNVDTKYRTTNGSNYTLVSNPYDGQNPTTEGWTLTTRDTMGRVVRVEHFGASQPPPFGSSSPSSGAVRIEYPGTITKVWDEADKMRESEQDALGRIIRVIQAGETTYYRYDALDNLVGVCQNAQFLSDGTCPAGYRGRQFAYDAIGRLKQATNPESGTTTYDLYDRNGNLTQRTNARGAVINYVYDDLNRITNKTYSGSVTAPTVTYQYDGNGVSCPGSTYPVGRLSVVSSSASRTTYDCYNAFGQVTRSTQSTGGTDYVFQYGYNLAGSLTSMTYPSLRQVSYTIDAAANRPTRVTGTLNGQATQYAGGTSAITYFPHGAIKQMPLANGLSETAGYNNRLQMNSVSAGTYSLGFGYGTTNNNGNLLQQTISAAGLNFTQDYGYDGANRLQTASEGSNWSYTFGYDGYGNMYVSAANPGVDSFTPTGAGSFNTNNQFTPTNIAYAYDLAGNQTAIGGYGFTYDAENRQITSTINGNPTTYSYDGDGRRVKKQSGSGTTTFVYDAQGQLAAEYSTTTEAAGGTQYLTADHLGSTRMVTNASAATTALRDYYPFGGEIPASMGGRTSLWSAADGLKQKFTGKERDAETGLDYFGARYFSGAQGRFTSPDKLNVTDDRLLVPSTLNKYAYAANNPLRFKDPDGRDVVALLEPPHGVRPGHFALFAHNPSTNQAAFMSFGPTDQSFAGQLLTLSGGPVGSTVSFDMPKSADDLRRDYTALSIQTSPEQAQDVINFINGFGAAENPYQLFQTNCSTVCRDALKAIGVLPRDYGSITPFGLWSALYGRFSNPAKQRFSTTTRYGEQFQSLRIDSQKGVDYGNPRFGMNTFDFIMLMLRQQQPKACVEVSDSATGSKSKQCE